MPHGFLAWTLAIPLLLSLTVPTAGQAPSSAPPEPKDSQYNVRDFGAVGDGQADDTQAFQTAMDAAGQAGGGIVLAPRGTYRIAGNLKVPIAVTLSGIWAAPPAHAGIRDASHPRPTYGTTLLAVAGAGSETGEPFIELTTNATLRGMVIHYPEQRPDATPTPYPYAIAMRGNNPAVLDVELLNPYNAIDASRNQRHLIRNVSGQPLRRGIYVDHIFDIGRIENVHWNPWWSMTSPVLEFMRTEGEAFIFGRTDWQYVHNTFCFGYRIGYRFIRTPSGVCNGNFLGIGADDAWEAAVLVDECAPMGLLITNGEFVNFRSKDPTMVIVGPKNTGAVRFVNCAYWGPNHQIARIAGTGTVGFGDCTFMQNDKAKEGRAAIQAESGTVLVRGCEFRESAPQVSLNPDVQRAVIVGNVFTGPERIVNNSKGDVQIGLNAATPTRAATEPTP
ncbi:MAG: hypothetical protein JXA69_09950 [Phycisphaerae bacterium]|nr:hypothetical protein [Phycisphaerae bacterium]